MKTFKQSKNVAKTPRAGFTLVELMVTITIVVLVTGLIMIQYSSFNNSVLLTDQAYLTAFDIREAQSLSVSARGLGSGFRQEYGLYFSLNTAFKNKYLLFQDTGTVEPAHYETGEEVGVPYKVDPRFIISNICGTTNGVETCGLNSLAISFKRPNFDAVFYSPGVNPESVRIQFAPLNGALSRSVIVYKTGQVSVQ